MRLGFLGTGVITSAIVTGLCTLPEAIGPIQVSPRNAENAAKLADAYADVSVEASNQAVIDHSDIVVLAILPQDRDAILGELVFRESQTVINLLAGITNDEIAPLVSPAKRIIRAVPLPCVAEHVGPIAIYPPDEIGLRVFDPLGTVVAVHEEAQLETLSIITALMAPYYALLDAVVTWACREKVDRKQAADYTAAMFAALSAMSMEVENGRLNVLVEASMTPGGLNEKAMEMIRENGGFEPWVTALEAVKQKIAKG